MVKKNKIKQLEEITAKFKENFLDLFYFEIQRHNDIGEKNLENVFMNLSEKFKIPLIASQEIFYIDQDMYEAHDALLCIGEKTYVDEKNRKKYTDQHYIKTSEELKKFTSFKNFLYKTVKISEPN